MRKRSTGAGTAVISDMNKDRKHTLLLIAAAFVIAAVLVSFKIIDSPKISNLDAVSVTLTHESTQVIRSSGKVNINTADLSGLMTLEEIGETRAKAIIEYRKENGKFHSVDELKNISCIGETILELNRDRITL